MPNVYIASSEKGLVVGQLDTETGKVEIVQTVGVFTHGQFVTKHPTKPLIYASGELDNKTQIFSFAIDDGKLTLLNQQVTNGNDGCHITIDDESNSVLLVNYGGSDRRGSALVFPIDDDGKLQPHSDFVQYEGSSVNSHRQFESHPHMISPTPDNRFVLVSDLGTDKIMVHRLEDGKLIAHQPDSIALHAGAGCRHFAFHPTKPYMYVINELDSTLNAYTYTAETGIWTKLSNISTLPDNPDTETHPDANTDFVKEGVNYPADIHVHPSGKFLYGSNRGHNSIAVYDIDSGTGNITLKGHQSTFGDWCRSFAIDSSGQFLLVGNQWSNTVVTLKIDSETGELSDTGNSLEIPSPVCVIVD